MLVVFHMCIEACTHVRYKHTSIIHNISCVYVYITPLFIRQTHNMHAYICRHAMWNLPLHKTIYA